MQGMDTAPARGAQGQPATQASPEAALPQQGLTPDQLRKMQVMAKQAMGFLLEDATADQIIKRAQSGDPMQVVVQTVLEVLRRLYEAAKGAGQMQGGPEDMVTMMVTGLQIIGDLTEMLIAAGVLQQQQATEFIAQASKQAIEQHNAQVQQGGAA